jgi:hypothetical protein
MPRPKLALLHSLLGRPPHAPACRAPHTQRVLCSGAAATQRKAPRRPPRVGPQCLGSNIRCERGLLTPCSTPRPNGGSRPGWASRNKVTRADAAAGRGHRTRRQTLEIQHSRTAKFPSRKRRTPAGVRAATRSESRARVHAAVAAGRTGPSLGARNSRAACGCRRECPWLPGPWELGILTGMLTNSLTAHKNFVKLGIWPYEAH